MHALSPCPRWLARTGQAKPRRRSGSSTARPRLSVGREQEARVRIRQPSQGSQPAAHRRRPARRGRGPPADGELAARIDHRRVRPEGPVRWERIDIWISENRSGGAAVPEVAPITEDETAEPVGDYRNRWVARWKCSRPVRAGPRAVSTTRTRCIRHDQGRVQAARRRRHAARRPREPWLRGLTVRPRTSARGSRRSGARRRHAWLRCRGRRGMPSRSWAAGRSPPAHRSRKAGPRILPHRA